MLAPGVTVLPGLLFGVYRIGSESALDSGLAGGGVLDGGLGVLPLLLLLFGGFLLQSATEELALRGYVQRNMIEWKGASRNLVWILIVPSLLFSISHGFNPDYSALAAVNTVLIGVLFGAIVLASGNLWGAIGIHTGWNFGLGCLWSLPVSGLRTPRLVEMRIAETGSTADFFFGGDYGPEGGLIVTGLVVAGIVWALPRAMHRWTADQWGTQSNPVG
jgi:membrane protease YdiL (CAAX protease family)